MGDPRSVNEGDKWRLKITDSNGEAHSVNVQLPDRSEVNDSYWRYISDQLFVDRDDLQDVLDNWSPKKLRKHLEKQSPEDLRSKVFGARTAPR